MEVASSDVEEGGVVEVTLDGQEDDTTVEDDECRGCRYSKGSVDEGPSGAYFT